MGDDCCKKCPTGPTGSAGSTGATGPTGTRGQPGTSTFLKSYYGFQDGPVTLTPGNSISVASVAAGTVTSPARILEIWATFACSSTQVPNTVDFWLTIDGLDQRPGGSELSFVGPGMGQSGAICLRIPVSAGAHAINLEAMASQPGASIDPTARPHKDHAALMVDEVSV